MLDILRNNAQSASRLLEGVREMVQHLHDDLINVRIERPAAGEKYAVIFKDQQMKFPSDELVLKRFSANHKIVSKASQSCNVYNETAVVINRDNSIH